MRYFRHYLYTLLLGGFGGPAIVLLVMAISKVAVTTLVAMMLSPMWWQL
jgi:hypothetical protein